MILESWRAEGAAGRLAFAETLRQGPRTPAAMTLARAAVRAMARDSGRFGARMSPDQFRQLVAFADDGALRADAPALPLPDREPWVGARDALDDRDRPASDVGTMPACDAAFLPNGLTLVAPGRGRRAADLAGRPNGRASSTSRPTAWWSPTAATGPSPSPAAATTWRLARIDLAAGGPKPGATPASTPSPRTTTAPSGSWPRRTAWSRWMPPPPLRGPWGVPDPGRGVAAIVRSPSAARC